MADSIILLEERKEVTTFLLDEGTITETTVTTPTGETPGYEYSGVKVKVDDAVTFAYQNNKLVQPVEDIQSYYGIDNIDFLGTTQADGGSLVGDKEYIGFDLRNAPLTVLYSKSSGTTTAPITSDENIADFYPIIEIMRKDIYDELPQYTKLFIQSKVGILLNKPGLALKGTCRP